MQLTLAAAFVATAFAVLQGAVAGDFSASCTDIEILDNNILVASCGNGHGTNIGNSFDLNGCIGISGPNLVCQINGNYAEKCKGCVLTTGVDMVCNCPSGGAVINLDTCVGNTDGSLVC